MNSARGAGYGCDASAPPEPARQIDDRVADCVTIETRGARREIAARPAPTKLTPDTYGNCDDRRVSRNQFNGAVMNSLSTGHDSSDAPSTSSGAQTAPAAVSADPVARAFANADASASSDGE